MLAYECKQCGKVMVGGYENEFGEHFCSKKCYETYCKNHNYKSDFGKLKIIMLP